MEGREWRKSKGRGNDKEQKETKGGSADVKQREGWRDKELKGGSEGRRRNRRNRITAVRRSIDDRSGFHQSSPSLMWPGREHEDRNMTHLDMTANSSCLAHNSYS